MEQYVGFSLLTWRNYRSKYRATHTLKHVWFWNYSFSFSIFYRRLQTSSEFSVLPGIRKVIMDEWLETENAEAPTNSTKFSVVPGGYNH